MAKSRELKKIHLAYKNMKDRCYNTANSAYGNYGGRGILVEEPWFSSRDEFTEWALSNGHSMELSLDRIDNDGNYSPDNCRWATTEEQLSNRRVNRIVSFGGKTMTVSQWERELGLTSGTLSKRLNTHKIPIDRALTGNSLREVYVFEHGTRRGYERFGCRCSDCRGYNNQRAREVRAKKKGKQ